MRKLAAPVTSVLLLAACSQETVGNFTYNCGPGGGMFDGKACEHRLSGQYLLRYGEGSGDRIVLALDLGDGASAGLLQGLDEGDFVEAIAFDRNLLVARTRHGRFYAVLAGSEKWPKVTGPMSAEVFADSYPNAPAWREVQ